MSRAILFVAATAGVLVLALIIGWLVTVPWRRRNERRRDTAPSLLATQRGLVFLAILMVEVVAIIGTWPVYVGLRIPDPPARRLVQAALASPGIGVALTLAAAQLFIAQHSGRVERVSALIAITVGLISLCASLITVPLAWRWLEPAGLTTFGLILTVWGAWMLATHPRSTAPAHS